ncbi:hypothetical protein P280DRAFT_405197 [Massarina eburnea CBS 473.64]|uniref:NADH:ubiquinone oxidoreductase 20.1kD subunit n=1 Tax=Massarina eburnea CBS 473.64 TaxID=1395130 RepID=A0A6A6RTI1_9PLEO|nr:hypothetical protein P280DRAFT_405197 [Massarina eburnea CBS 473.64]
MLSRRIVAARPLARALAPAIPRRPHAFQQVRTALTDAERVELADPNMNGGYINPPPELRNNRDPYDDWWDQQDRRNYGEPCHEDHDILGAIALHDYNHFTPSWGFVLLGSFIATAFGLCGVMSLVYPDKVSVPKQYEGGLEAELGGPRAVRVSRGAGVLGRSANEYRRQSPAIRPCGSISVVNRCVHGPNLLFAHVSCCPFPLHHPVITHFSFIIDSCVLFSLSFFEIRIFPYH